MGHGEARDHRSEQLALARTGRADDQPVRAVAAQVGLLDVKDDRVALRVEAHGNAQPFAQGLGRPKGGCVQVREIVDAQELGQVDGP